MSLIAKIEAGAGWTPLDAKPTETGIFTVNNSSVLFDNKDLGTYASVYAHKGVVSLHMSPLQVAFLETNLLCVQQTIGPVERWDDEQIRIYMKEPDYWAHLHEGDPLNSFRVIALEDQTATKFKIAA